MKRFLIYIGVFVAGMVIQFSLNQFFSIAGVAPNFLLVFTIFIGLMYGPVPGQLFGFIWGLSWDIMSVDLFGSHVFLLTTVGFVSGLLSKKWNEDKFSAQAVLVGLSSIFFIIGKYLLYQIFSPGEYKFTLNYIVIFQPFYNVIMAPAVFAAGLILSRVFDKVIYGEEDFKRL